MVNFPCPLFPNNTGYELSVVDIRVSVSCFSLLGSIFVIGLIWLFKKYKFFTQRLILYLSIASLISSIAYILGRFDYGSDNKQHLCIFTGFLLLYSDWSVLLSTIGVTANLFFKVTCERLSNKYEFIYVMLSFGVPVLFIWIPFTFDAYGPSGAWCWIRNKNVTDCTPFIKGKIIQLLVWYIPLYALILFLFIVYVYIAARVSYRVRTWQGLYDPQVQRQRILMREEIKPLMWYPLIYFLVQLFPFINRIVYNVTDNAYIGLFVLHVLTSPLTGVLIAFAYALDKETLKRLNWNSIKASLRFRSTSKIVTAYSAEETFEEELEATPRSTYFSESSEGEDENKRLVSTRID
ncbi:PREDICTED: cyclic AMP receptor-like protein A [Amphimedon queenslandica]|uniref:G-protein coupled receptors family 2 profile 2 domain-containing protein n=1 Tax=Amphimedon queenslandica TaxID=400682 RepID=A0A1X7ULJ5_AMPQE|nr:PREDICTED: cyclic AMP receptor-like protein A [Amphimedon queenslandica]|eukprot:XP_011404768.2 PREDICTED: cyclic AMP receptor-like protein A [Amphimedon queenslandica]